jgi:hypothetical protein
MRKGREAGDNRQGSKGGAREGQGLRKKKE